MKDILRVLNYRPFTVIGILIAVHTLLYGAGYMVPGSGFENTVLYDNLSMIAPPFVFGGVMVVIGLYSLVSWVKDLPRHVERSSSALSLFWLFAGISYIFSGDVGLGLAIGLSWSLLSGYLGFCYKHRIEIIMSQANGIYRDILNK